MIQIDMPRGRFVALWCYGEGQYNKAAAQDRAGLPAGQHLEALRHTLARLKKALPPDLIDEINEAIANAENETNKP
jgi:hypothetical protein